jgi:hypothetical protein
MPTEQKKLPAKSGVSSLWRTATVCMLAGMALHWWTASTPAEPKDQALTIRGDELPPEEDYDPRLDKVLDAVDLDNVPVPDALMSIARKASINLVLTREIADRQYHTPGQDSPPVTVHLKNVKVADAFNAVYAFWSDRDLDVRHYWFERDGLFYPGQIAFQPLRLYTRIYNVKKILDRHKGLESAHSVETGPFRGIYYDGPANWLEEIIERQTSGIFTSRPIRDKCLRTAVRAELLFLITVSLLRRQRRSTA